MIYLCLLLSWIGSVVVFAGGRTPNDCKIGDKWTEKFIRLECYQGIGAVVKGVRPIGCVPTNKETGAMIGIGIIFDEQYFTYSCTKKGEVAQYQIINCRDPSGKKIGVGETRKMADGSEWKCYKDKSGNIKLSQEKAQSQKKEVATAVGGGCQFEGKTYKAGQTWTKDVEMKAVTAGKKVTVGKGILYQCKRDNNKQCVSLPIGCVPSSGPALPNNGIALVNSMYLKCLIPSNGEVSMQIMSEDELSCKFEKTKVKTGEKYTAPNGDVYLCQFAVTSKLGCMIKGQMYEPGFVNLNFKEFFHCHVNGTGGCIEFPKSMTGCKLSNGEFKLFSTTWQNGTSMYRCNYEIKSNSVIPYVEFLGCEYNGTTVKSGKIVKEVMKKCARVGKEYVMRDLTTEEKAAFMKLERKVFGGSDGSGSGSKLLGVKNAPTPTSFTVPVLEDSLERAVELLKGDRNQGCKINGSIKPLHAMWQKGSEMYRCNFKISGTTVTPFASAYGCAYNGKAIEANNIIECGGTLKKCTKIGKEFAMRDLTSEKKGCHCD